MRSVPPKRVVAVGEELRPEPEGDLRDDLADRRRMPLTLRQITDNFQDVVVGSRVQDSSEPPFGARVIRKHVVNRVAHGHFEHSQRGEEGFAKMDVPTVEDGGFEIARRGVSIALQPRRGHDLFEACDKRGVQIGSLNSLVIYRQQ